MGQNDKYSCAYKLLRIKFYYLSGFKIQTSLGLEQLECNSCLMRVGRGDFSFPQKEPYFEKQSGWFGQVENKYRKSAPSWNRMCIAAWGRD
jgi:hypothetical protein